MQMFSIYPSAMLGIVFLLHIFADFNMQIGAGLDKFKQWRWWWDQIPSHGDWKKYKDDYKVALLLHSYQWSLVTCLPLIMCGGWVYLSSVAAHAAVHCVVDDLKANRMFINLVQDQAIHALQVLLIWAEWLVFR